MKQQAEGNEIYTRKQISAGVETAYHKVKQAKELIAVTEKAIVYGERELKVENDCKVPFVSYPVKLNSNGGCCETVLVSTVVTVAVPALNMFFSYTNQSRERLSNRGDKRQREN